MAAQPDTEESLLAALHERMIKAGEWSKLITKMNNRLKASEYGQHLTEIATKDAKEKAASQGIQPSVEELLERLLPEAKKSIPESVKEEIMADIMQFLENNLEVES